MKQMILTVLGLLILAPPVIAGDEKTTVRATTSETRTHYQFHSDPDPGKSGWKFEQDRVYNYEIKGSDHKGMWKEKSNRKHK